MFDHRVQTRIQSTPEHRPVILCVFYFRVVYIREPSLRFTICTPSVVLRTVFFVVICSVPFSFRVSQAFRCNLQVKYNDKQRTCAEFKKADASVGFYRIQCADYKFRYAHIAEQLRLTL